MLSLNRAATAALLLLTAHVLAYDSLAEEVTKPPTNVSI